MNDELDTNGRKAESAPDAASVPKFAGESRRRFTRAGLSASGVLMTLAARSSLACHAISPSGFTSINQSTHGAPKTSHCRLPYYWAANIGNWPTQNNSKFFRQIFNACPPHSPYHKYSCADLIAGNCEYDSSQGNVGQYLVAAYLNAYMHWSDDFLPESLVIQMGNDWLSSGVFHPTANVSWDAYQIAAYLQNTQS